MVFHSRMSVYETPSTRRWIARNLRRSKNTIYQSHIHLF